MLRTKIFWAIAVIVFATLNTLIYKKEVVLNDGKTILLDLAPEDPLSLMQGYYMNLEYRLAQDIRRHFENLPEIKKLKWDEKEEKMPKDGHVVLEEQSVNKARNISAYMLVGESKRIPLVLKNIYKGQELSAKEHLLRFRKRHGQYQISTGSYFFQEGHAKYYETAARYGEVKVTDAGDAVMVGLRNTKFKTIVVPKDEKKKGKK